MRNSDYIKYHCALITFVFCVKIATLPLGERRNASSTAGPRRRTHPVREPWHCRHVDQSSGSRMVVSRTQHCHCERGELFPLVWRCILVEGVTFIATDFGVSKEPSFGVLVAAGGASGYLALVAPTVVGCPCTSSFSSSFFLFKQGY